MDAELNGEAGDGGLNGAEQAESPEQSNGREQVEGEEDEEEDDDEEASSYKQRAYRHTGSCYIDRTRMRRATQRKATGQQRYVSLY